MMNPDMSKAPKGEPILALIERDLKKCGGGECKGRYLCMYHAHGEGMGYLTAGIAVIEWGGAFDDSSHEYTGAFLPDWWFLSGSDFEVVANPVAWCRISSLVNSSIHALHWAVQQVPNPDPHAEGYMLALKQVAIMLGSEIPDGPRAVS